MTYRALLTLLLSALLLPLAQGSRPAPVRWMPFGDSITDYGCWRAWVWERVVRRDGRAVDLVGSRATREDCAGLDYDRDHEGHPGHQAADMAARGMLVGWLRQNPADVVTMHLGTVDILRGRRATQEVLDALGLLVDQMRESNPAMRIIVAQIIPLPVVDDEVRELNAAIPAYMAGKNSTASPIWVVDQWTGFTSDDLYDGLHPSASGDVKIADKFYPALAEAIQSILEARGGVPES